MKIAITVPWRSSPEREYPKDIVDGWYLEKMPEADIFFVDDEEHEIFNRSATRNKCVKDYSDYDVIIINDADTVPTFRPLRTAIEQCQYSGRVHLPYNKYYCLTDKGFQDFESGIDIRFCENRLVENAISGVLVLTPETWWKHNGQDENFIGWGFEDAAWYMAHSTLIGKPVRHFGEVYAFPQKTNNKSDKNYKKNGERVYHYEKANGSYEKMYELVFNNKLDGLV